MQIILNSIKKFLFLETGDYFMNKLGIDLSTEYIFFKTYINAI